MRLIHSVSSFQGGVEGGMGEGMGVGDFIIYLETNKMISNYNLRYYCIIFTMSTPCHQMAPYDYVFFVKSYEHR